MQQSLCAFTYLCTHSYVSYSICFTTLFSFLGILHPGGLWRSSKGSQCSGPDIQLQTTLSSSIFCARDPDAALNAGHRRLLTKLGERGVLCACLKEVHAIKNSLPSCQCIAIKNSWAGLLSAFSRAQVDSLFVPLPCHNSPFTASLCWLLCASAITEAKSAS